MLHEWRKNMKTLVLYYSNTGNNAWLSRKIAATLGADIEPIAPRLNLLPLLILFSLLKFSPGIKKLSHHVEEYDTVVLCGPIWMGQLIFPLRTYIKKYTTRMKKMYFATCCGGGDDTKDDRFGYGGVFNQVRQLAGDTCVHCEAFSIGLVLPEEKRKDTDAMMKVRLSEETFKGEFKTKFDEFISKLRR